MKKIELIDGYAISTINNQGERRGSITISKDNISKGMVLLDANQLAELICDLKEVYLSIANFY